MRHALARRRGVSEKRMFGGVCFLLDENMLCVSGPRGFIFRVGPEREREALERRGARPMVLGSRRMRGFVRVDPRSCDARALRAWLDLAKRYVAMLPAKEDKR